MTDLNSITTIGLTIQTAGEVLVGLTVLLVHRKMMRHHTIDKAVQAEISHEQVAGVLGIAMIIGGFAMTVLS